MQPTMIGKFIMRDATLKVVWNRRTQKCRMIIGENNGSCAICLEREHIFRLKSFVHFL